MTVIATRPYAMVDGNEAAARIAHLLSEVIAIYPITPASPMGELADAWSHAGKPNLWGVVPDVVEMQSEAGAAGAIHGSLSAGALSTSFTASQGLLLMLPNMYKIAGELTPAVIHVAARTVATHALSIFGDHSDVMGARQTGFALLASASVQEAQDMALISHLATLESRVPFLHFFDGFRTSHEISKIELIEEETIRGLIDEDLIAAHRRRALNPSNPSLRGTAQNPDVFFQAREASNPFYDSVPGVVARVMDLVAEETGRRYRLFDYDGAPDAETVVVVMGSGSGAVGEAVEELNRRGGKVGVVTVRLYRPFDVNAFVDVLPETVRRVVALDRTKEPGAVGEPLYQDVVAALAEAGVRADVIGGRYGLSSKEFTPAMAAAVFEEAALPHPRRHFTVGIRDDVSGLSLDFDPDWWSEPADVVRAVFYGLGSDGTVGANKNSVKIIGESTDLYAQGYFVYDSKKSGSRTVSHLRVSPRPIESTYLIDDADFVAVHQFDLLESLDALEICRPGGTVLLNTPYRGERLWDALPVEAQRHILDKELAVWAVDAAGIAREAGLGGRVNTVLQTCFFHLTDFRSSEDGVAAIKSYIQKSYGPRGQAVVRRNEEAVDNAIAAMFAVTPGEADGARRIADPVPAVAPDFVKRVTGAMLAGKGDLLPVSALPVDGTFPTGTARWEKRSIATEIPIWDPELCIDCGRCALVCPHAAILFKAFPSDTTVPEGFAWKEPTGKDLRGMRVVIQVAPDDCTGCGVCVEVCPAKSKEVARHKAINMQPKGEHLERERRNFSYFLEIPDMDRSQVNAQSVKGSQLLRPLFEFSGACAGCGETPYLKLITQMMGDRMIVANATGCSSIYGGNLPTTPWTTDDAGRGPAWSNSLFEDNAEFGLGMRLALEAQRQDALLLVTALAPELGSVAMEILDLFEGDDASSGDELVVRQRDLVSRLREQLAGLQGPLPRRLEGVADSLVERSVWIVGGDGWAYDIGFGGLDHVLASGRDINILVLDTEVYSNTGGQASKSTPRAAIAKFAAGGKATGKKDLGQIAMSYGNVYVGQVAMGANPTQTVKTLAEAEAHRGVSLVIAYSPCIAHGFDMTHQLDHQKAATDSGYWPLYRYDPAREVSGEPGLKLDSKKPTIPFKQFAATETRFAMLGRVDPTGADRLMQKAQQDIDDRWSLYEQMVDVHRTAEYVEVEE
ncbi:MAG TPA: pyruvate:ferredoxin (flavodoxin) oxidoreductase [Acidimicrobiia bacterium]|nr:pyruvate:ferredoxin (flavodoxin) oxidoreductase [Acidimicrobiia bacterium]